MIIRLVDSLYRNDKDLARRLLVAAIGELDSELEETAYRWQRGRMEDLGFADYYEALEVYRELDLASVRIGEVKQAPLRATVDAAAGNGDALRVPTALAQRLSDVGGSPFARAAQKLAAREEIEELRFALVALTNRVLAADRVAPGDDDAVAATLQRLAATLDLAIERLAPGDDERGSAALRTIPLIRLFRAGRHDDRQGPAPRAGAAPRRAVRPPGPGAGRAGGRRRARIADTRATAVPPHPRPAARRR